MNLALRFVFLSFALASAIPNITQANPNDLIFASEFEQFNARSQAPIATTPSALQKAQYIIDRGAKALRYIGRPEVVDSLNGLSDATYYLVNNGVQVTHTHTFQKSLIPQIGFAAAGLLASACGLGVITYTALQNDQKETKPKYIAGAGMLGLGIASLFTSYFMSTRA